MSDNRLERMASLVHARALMCTDRVEEVEQKVSKVSKELNNPDTTVEEVYSAFFKQEDIQPSIELAATLATLYITDLFDFVNVELTALQRHTLTLNLILRTSQAVEDFNKDEESS